jgi:hypothetical protein
MSIHESNGPDDLREIARAVVQDIHPEELFLFDDIYRNFSKQRSRPAPEMPLGFGIDQPGSEVIGSVVISAVSEVLKYLIKSAADDGFLTRIFAKKKKRIKPLTPDQLKAARKIIEEQARNFGLNETKARQLANATIGVISTRYG